MSLYDFAVQYKSFFLPFQGVSVSLHLLCSLYGVLQQREKVAGKCTDGKQQEQV